MTYLILADSVSTRYSGSHTPLEGKAGPQSQLKDACSEEDRLPNDLSYDDDVLTCIFLM